MLDFSLNPTVKYFLTHSTFCRWTGLNLIRSKIQVTVAEKGVTAATSYDTSNWCGCCPAVWLKWHWFVVIGLGTFACRPHVDSAFEILTFKVRTQVKFDIFLKVVQVGGSHDLTKNRCIFNKARRSWLSGNRACIFSFCAHNLSVNHLNRTPLWSLQRQKPKLHWYQISFRRVWTKNKDTGIILLFSCLLHICICIHTIYSTYQFSQTNQWLRVTDSFGASS